LQLVLLFIPLYNKTQQHTSSCYAQYTVYHQGKTKENIIAHLQQIIKNNCYKKYLIKQLLLNKYKSNILKISQIKEYTKPCV